MLSSAVKYLELLRKVIGTESSLMVDCHGRINHTTARSFCEMVEGLDIAFIEEPSWPEYPEGLAYVKEHTSIPVAAGERVYTKWQYRDLLEKRAVSIIQPDICHAGGISETKKIANMAEAYCLPVAPHNPLSAVSTAACLSLAASIPNFAILEIGSSGLGEGLIKKLFKVVNGYIELSDELENSEDDSFEVPSWFHPDGSVADW